VCILCVSDGSSVNFTSLGLPEIGSDGHREIWMLRLREVGVIHCLFNYFISPAKTMESANKR
jgi:hypothetical protein